MTGKIILITGAQGTGKTTKAMSLISGKSFKECKAESLDIVLTLYGAGLDFVLIDGATEEEVQAASKEYKSHDYLSKPILIICTQAQSLAVEVEYSELINLA